VNRIDAACVSVIPAAGRAVQQSDKESVSVPPH